MKMYFHKNKFPQKVSVFNYIKLILAIMFLFLAGFTHISLSTLQATGHYSGEDNTIRIMTYNIRNAKGLDNVTDYKRISDIILSVNPDVIALQELDSVTGRSEGINVVAELSKYTGMHPVFGTAISFNGGKYGVGLLSKKIPLSTKNVALPGKEEKRTLLIVEFDDYVICSTHLSLTQEDRKVSVGIINEEIKNFNKPVFMAGDLNAEPESETIQLLSEKWQLLTNQHEYTFPANDPKETIDYILGYTPETDSFSIIQSKVVDEPIASDHRPIYVDVKMENKFVKK